MERMVRTGLLYDFYGKLLTEKQRQAMELYYLENWSLTEIAASDGISKQAVYDILQRSEKIIEEFEEKLGLLQRFLDQQKILNDISRRVEKVLTSLPEDSTNQQELIAINRQIHELAEAEMQE